MPPQGDRFSGRDERDLRREHARSGFDFAIDGTERVTAPHSSSQPLSGNPDYHRPISIPGRNTMPIVASSVSELLAALSGVAHLDGGRVVIDDAPWRPVPRFCISFPT